MQVCTICNSGWEIKDDEKYCGWCGAPLEGFEVIFEKDFPELRYIDYSKEYFIPFIIKNIGIKPIEIIDVVIEEI
jgi:hypothetical protein